MNQGVLSDVKPITPTKLCQLNPGIQINGKPVTECEVSLLTRNQQKVISDPAIAEEDRGTQYLSQSIVRLGDLTESTRLYEAVGFLTLVDEVKIRQTIKELEQEYLQPVTVPEPELRTICRVTDITSEPFALNPGIQSADGTWQRSCIIRLIRRGEWKQIQAEPDARKREDLILLFTIVQIGDILKVEQQHIDNLLETDIERINKEAEVLRARYALDTKSAEG